MAGSVYAQSGDPTGQTAVPLSSVANVSGISTDDTVFGGGGLDGAGNAYSAHLLGPSLTYSGTTYVFGVADQKNALLGTDAPVLPLIQGNYATLKFLGTGMEGNQVSQVFQVTYTDGSATKFTQSMSDWYTPQTYPGEAIAQTTLYRDISTGTIDHRNFNLYQYSFQLDSSKVVKSLTLPNNSRIAILAVTLLTPRIWVAAWADAPAGLQGPADAEQTFREIVKPTVGSRGTVRLHFSNYFGAKPVKLGAVHVGIQASGAAVTGDIAVTFGGVPSVTIPAGGFVVSDDVPLAFSYGEVLAVTEYVSGSWSSLTSHNQAGNSVTNYATAPDAGDKTADTSGRSFTQSIFETYLLNRVDVFGDYKETIAAFGSSTTDGLHSGLDQHKTYPEQLAEALHAAGHDDVAIANSGISGNQVLAGGITSGLSRFSRDVVSLPNVKAVIDYLGANDLRNSCISADKLIGGVRNLIMQAHQAGLKIYVATTAPSTFCGAQNPGGYGARFPQGSGEEEQRFLLNAWDLSRRPSDVNGVLEQPSHADAVIDFSKALTDPGNTSYMLPQFDSGDDIHPNASGYAAMVKAIPLSLF